MIYHFKRPQTKFFKHHQSSLTKPSQKRTRQNQQIYRINRINTSLQNLIKVNQWEDTSEVIEWFKNIKNKQKHKFILFDIKNFYPTIAKDLLTKCLKFAEEKVQIPDDDKKVIYHAKKSLLFNEGGAWMKKDGLLDMTRGRMIVQRYVNSLGHFHKIKPVENMCQYLKTKAALNLKEQKRAYKQH